MNNNRIRGEKGEALAAVYLQGQGYQVVERNWRHGHKEIDLICKYEDLYIFIEVKTRHSTLQGMPEESVSASKIRSVTDAARVYLYEKDYRDIRFDVISVLFKADGSHEMLHIRDAFY